MLLRQLCALVLLTVLTASAQTNRWDADIAAFEAQDRTNLPPKGAVLFIGSSSIRLWKSLASDCPQHPVINRGYGGSFLSDSVHFADRIVFPYQPRLIVLYAGGNDLNAGRTPEQVFDAYKAFVAKVRARLPATRVAYISIGPSPARWAQVEKIRAANTLIAAFARQQPKLDFIDVFPQMLGADGQPRPDIYQADRLHLNEKGYALWRDIVAPFLGGE